eukprot:scaffold8210_cov258-Pinguiococcus_pyrenoidosus.AAC.1
MAASRNAGNFMPWASSAGADAYDFDIDGDFEDSLDDLAAPAVEAKPKTSARTPKARKALDPIARDSSSSALDKAS